jgi:acyl-CoA synthetase (AMP-forming)/AMP-acid ligase II
LSPEEQFPETVQGLLRRAAETHAGRGIVFVDEDERKFTWAEIESQAKGLAAGLQSRGGVPGERVAVVCQGLRAQVTAFFGTIIAGLHPTILPTPISRRRLEGFVRHTSQIVRVAQPRFILVDEPVKEVGDPLLDAADLQGRADVVRFDELPIDPELLEPYAADPDSIAVIQFTSGSTSAPRGVILTHRSVTANVHAIVEQLEVGPDDVGGGWLPLYHDMGLIGNLLGATARSIGLVLTTPFNFLRRPRRWIEIMERQRITITAGPNVSYRHLLERGEPEGKDLGAWRVAIIGAEPIDPELLDEFSESFGKVGFPKSAFMPAYGLAEVGLIVTGIPATGVYDSIEVDRSILEEEGRVVPATESRTRVRIVGVGTPVRETTVRIVDEEGRERPDGRVGEITISGASLMQGYFNDAEATASALRDGWLYTGDLGYMQDGQLYVTGRKKELIIFQGRNYYPQDIERAIQSIEIVRPGSVVAFGTRHGNSEGVVIVAAPKDARNTEGIEAGVREVVADRLNLPVLDVILMESGRIPRTTSGKLCRGRCRDLYEEGNLS